MVKNYDDLDGLAKQMAECLISAYNKGYEQCFKDMTEPVKDNVRKSAVNDLNRCISDVNDGRL